MTPLPTSIYRAGAVHDVPLLLYEYPVSSAAQARASAIAASSRGTLPLSPDKLQMRKAGSGDALAGQAQAAAPIKPIKKGWPVQVRKHVGSGKQAGGSVKKTGKYSAFA